MNGKFRYLRYLHRFSSVVFCLLIGLFLASCNEEQISQNDSDLDTTAPTVSIESPTHDSVVLETVTIIATARDNIGISGVKFLLDDNDLSDEISSAPFEFNWNTTFETNEPHKLTALVRDTAGNTTSTSITVTVNNPVNDSEAPTAPTNLTVTSVSMSQINLAWTAATDNVHVAGYKVYRSSGYIGTARQINYSDDGLTAGEQYSYYVTAFDVAGNESLPSETKIVSTPAPDTTLPIVAFSTPANADTVSGTVQLTATASDNVAVSGVQFKLDNTNLGEEITSSPYGILWDTTIAANSQHTLTAVARDASGNIAATTITVTIDNATTDTEPPAAPSNLTASAASASQINLSWNAATDNVGVTGYNVYRSNGYIGTTNKTSYTDDGLTAGAQYIYYVTALDAAANESVPSNSKIASTASPDTSAPTVAFSNPANTDTVFGTVQLTAIASDNVAVAGVQFKLDNTNLGGEVTSVPYSISWDTTTADNTQHTLIAVARDAAGNNATASITITIANPTDVEPPTAPTNLTSSAVSASQIDLTWTASTDNVGVIQYEVYRDGSSLAFTTATTYSDTNLTPSTPYTYSVIAHDAAGNVGPPSDALTVTTTASSNRIYSTNFDLTENPISEGGAWSNTGLDWTYVVTGNGIAYGTHKATGYNDSYAILSGFATDHSVEATIYKTGQFPEIQEVELLLRWSQADHVATGYEVLWNANNEYASIVRWNGALGDFTILHRLSFPREPVTGDVMKAQIVGDLITVYLNGVTIGSYSDSTWKTGNPGIGFFSLDATGEQNPRFGFTSYSASDLQ